jgi:hypothetical protein
MKMYYLKHKKTGNPLRIFSYETDDSEFRTRYVLTDFESSLVWLVSDIKDIHFLYEKYLNGKEIHPEYSLKCNTPSYGDVKLDEYEINEVFI